MRALVALAIALLAIALHYRAPAVPPESAAPLAGVDAVRIIVVDLDRSIEFSAASTGSRRAGS